MCLLSFWGTTLNWACPTLYSLTGHLGNGPILIWMCVGSLSKSPFSLYWERVSLGNAPVLSCLLQAIDSSLLVDVSCANCDFGCTQLYMDHIRTQCDPSILAWSLHETGWLGLISTPFKITQKQEKSRKREPADSSSESKFGQGGFQGTSLRGLVVKQNPEKLHKDPQKLSWGPNMVKRLFGNNS